MRWASSGDWNGGGEADPIGLWNGCPSSELLAMLWDVIPMVEEGQAPKATGQLV